MTALLRSPELAARWCRERRAAGETLGLVPTMGALHAGHLGLVERAVGENDRAVVSVFVNPLQFNEASDFERYPRDLEADARLLGSVGADLAFTGSLEDFFPGRCASPAELVDEAYEDPGPRAAGLEGAYRPGHFRGVATIVKRLFEVVEPERAYFGAKDLQQTLVVRDVARRRGCPAIVVCPTRRDSDGLALSSRNLLLGAQERARALAIHAALQAARGRWLGGEHGAAALSAAMLSVLEPAGLAVDYAEARDPEHWSAERPTAPLAHGVALIAARAGSVRLIDNMELAGEDAT